MEETRTEATNEEDEENCATNDDENPQICNREFSQDYDHRKKQELKKSLRVIPSTDSNHLIEGI